MEFIENLGTILNQNIYLGFIIALIAGFISSFSPCTLSTLPLIIGYVGVNDENEQKKKKGLIYSICFCFGIIITFTILGIISVLLGTKLRLFRKFVVYNTWNYTCYSSFTIIWCI